VFPCTFGALMAVGCRWFLQRVADAVTESSPCPTRFDHLIAGGSARAMSSACSGSKTRAVGY
jgi:hypothetical protein